MTSDAVTPDGEVPARRVLKMVLGYQISGVVSVIAKLNIADRLVDGPRSAEELAAATGADPDALMRLMRVAVSLDLFDQVRPGVYAINPLGECLRSDNHSVHGVALAGGRPGHTRPVELLYEAITENRSVARDALGMEIWEYWDQHPETKAAMTEHLVEVNAAIGPAVQREFDLTPYKRIVDVGGNEGFFLATLLEAAPHATGVLFDRPAVMDDARKTMAAKGLADRVEFVGGDFHQSVPAGGDLYVLKGILHDSSNDAGREVLRRCHESAAPGATLIALEGILDDEPPFDPIVQLIDVNMLLMVNGRERSLPEFTALMAETGWEVEGTIPLPSTGYWPFHIIKARRV